MNISMPESMKAFVEEQATQKGYGTPSEYLRAVIRGLQERKAKRAALDAQLLEGVRSPRVHRMGSLYESDEPELDGVQAGSDHGK
jgi:antitoxin ParD1/3/4